MSTKYTAKGVEDKLDKLDTKVDALDSRLDDINVTLTRNTDSLELHMRRTEILENEVAPLKKHVSMMNAFAKIITFAALLAGLLKTVGVL